jgi:hypothetical protein
MMRRLGPAAWKAVDGLYSHPGVASTGAGKIIENQRLALHGTWIAIFRLQGQARCLPRPETIKELKCARIFSAC